MFENDEEQHADTIRLYDAVKNYVEKKGGTVTMISAVQLQIWPQDPDGVFHISVRCMGRLPELPKAPKSFRVWADMEDMEEESMYRSNTTQAQQSLKKGDKVEYTRADGNKRGVRQESPGQVQSGQRAGDQEVKEGPAPAADCGGTK